MQITRNEDCTYKRKETKSILKDVSEESVSI